jgi:DNA-directed RNA polymerase specialized sigma24 family protein
VLQSLSHSPQFHTAGEAVEPPTVPKNRWILTQDAFDLLLAQLDSDRQQAGIKYEALRRKLVKFFEWRRATFPEDLADDTINRVARNLEAGENIRELAAYCVGIARNVFLESLRSHQHEKAIQAMPDLSATPSDDSEHHLDCLEGCLRALSPADSNLIVQYYDDAQSRIANRRDLADRLGIPLNALRIRAHRIRLRLEACVENCVKQSAT